MAGTLFVVATPIGHLEDITARALRVLGEVSIVAAEDTRHTAKLLRHFGITTPLVSLHQHNEAQRSDALVARLGRGESVAIVSDAGTPAISDPGARVVRAARTAGIRVEAIPGPSAVAAAISVAGLEDSRFAFLGFPPIRVNDKNKWVSEVMTLRRQAAIVFFEAPHRIVQTIEKLADYIKSPIIVCRELTKLHESVLVGPPQDLVNDLRTHSLGEFTVVLPREPPASSPAPIVSDDQIRTLFGHITDSPPSGSRRDAIREVARQLGVSSKRVYNATKGTNSV
jgi:16S rRNA (cytidine1402-2'-O)-methyltransferase